MSQAEIIHQALERASRRRRWARGLDGLWRGLLAGAIASLLLSLVWHIFPAPTWVLAVSGLVPLATGAVGLLAGLARRFGLNETARWVDNREQLQERLSTALELESRPSNAWQNLVLADAAERASQLAPERLVPFSLNRYTRWTVIVLALAVGLVFVPEYRSEAYLRKQAEAHQIRNTGKQLAELTRRNLEKREPVLESTRNALETVAELGEKIAVSTPTRTEALKDLANAAERLQKQLNELGQTPDLRKLAANKPGASSDPASLQKQIDDLQKQLGSDKATPDALQELQRQLQKLGTAAQAMAQSQGGTQAEREQLAADMRSAAAALEQLGVDLPKLDQAIEALAASDPSLAVRDLQAAANDLQQMRDMASSLQQLREQVQEAGKDLAEQLERGQAAAAQETLNRMIKQLKEGALTAEQLAAMQKEVSQGASKATDYGKVSEHLKKAAEKLGAGDKPQAASEMAAAAEELSKLAQQMGDAESLGAELAALAQASQAIGRGEGWQPSGKPGAGKGNKPGSGVGTWANENQQWAGDASDGWDNSNVNRPDSDARGKTEREKKELADALKPTKVKGQFSPGSQMPSVTLKGVSIRGQSTVEYQAAAAAAQSEAESALSQEKVPPAYKNSVRDYFDDLKK